MIHKEDLITPPRLTKPKPKADAEPIPMVTLWLTKNGKTTSITKPERDIEHWRKKFAKDYVVTDTEPPAPLPIGEGLGVGHCGHECFKKNTGVACSRCKH